MNTTAHVSALLSRLDTVRARGDGWEARCPAHDDQHASLSVGVGDDGRALIHCHAGCEHTAVLQALGLTDRDLFAVQIGRAHQSNGKLGRIVAEYDYCDELGKLVYQVVRYTPKNFRQRRPDGNGGTVWSLGKIRRVLYRLPELLAADPAAWVFVVEGEKDAESLRVLGLVATTNVGGAGKWRREYGQFLRGRRVVIMPDNDEPGREHSRQVARSLHGTATEIKILDLPGLPQKGDVSDWLAASGTVERLPELVEAAPKWEPHAAPSNESTQSDDQMPHCTLSDLGNARRLAKLHIDKLRYCHPWEKFVVWDGSRWAIDETGHADRLAKDVADSLWREAKDCGSDTLHKFAARSASSASLSAMLRQVRSEPRIPILPRDLDRDPWLLNCVNGTVDLRSGMVRPPDRRDLITKLCLTPYNADAPCQKWNQFLDAIFEGKRTLVDFMRHFLGYCLTGDVREQVLPIFWGMGSNGKSTLLTAFMDTLGTDYASKAVAELLLAKKHDSHPTERADLFGKRFVPCVETSDGRKLNEALVKELTGGDPIKARRMYEDLWQFTPTHKAVLCTNHRPRIHGSDHAIWRRVALVPFTVKFWDPDKGETGLERLRADKGLAHELAKEHEGILAFAVQGCLEWQKHGLVLPAEVRAATAEYRSAEDGVQAFVDECCVVGSDSLKVKATPLYAEYRKWSEDRGESPMSQRRFGDAITEKGFQKTVSNGVWYKQLGLAATGDR